MEILLLGSGPVTSRLNLALNDHGHRVAAQLATFTAQHLELFDCRAVLAISPECSVTTEALVQAAGQGKFLFVIAGASDGLAAWAAGSGVPAYAFPPTDLETDRLLADLRRAETGGLSAGDQYRRTVLGGDLAARLESGMAIRKIAVTSPKGGTGKTTTAVNLALAFALSGVSTYLVDADANAGSIQYHLRLRRANATLIGLLRRELGRGGSTGSLDGLRVKPGDVRVERGGPLATVAAGAAYLEAFTPLDGLPTLKVLPGLITDDLADEALQDEGRIAAVLAGLYEAGVGAGGVVIMDVGINPAHIVHRAALRLAEGIAIVIKPEIPDLAETRRWIDRMLASLAGVAGREAAFEFIGNRVKLCYNQVLGAGFKAAHRTLQDALRDDDIPLKLAPNGVLPLVEPHLAIEAVNSDRVQDVLIWRYQREKPEELKAYAEALLGFGSHFVPAVREGAIRAGLIEGSNGHRPGGLFKRWRR